MGAVRFDHGLTAGSSGNISVRLDDGWMLTPTNACLGRLDPARIPKLVWDGRRISGDPPSTWCIAHGIPGSTDPLPLKSCSPSGPPTGVAAQQCLFRLN
jgi:hypothetical protein